MKLYRSHKRVLAAPIRTLYMNTGGTHYVEFMDGTNLVVPSLVFARGTPSPGDYLLQYPDNYYSWSPKAIFEDGYTEVTDE